AQRGLQWPRGHPRPGPSRPRANSTPANDNQCEITRRPTILLPVTMPPPRYDEATYHPAAPAPGPNAETGGSTMAEKRDRQDNPDDVAAADDRAAAAEAAEVARDDNLV